MRHAVACFVPLLGLASLLATGPAEGAIQCTTGACCVDDVNGSVGANCTSNDVTFTVVGLGTQSNGCINNSDTLTILMQATVRNTTAQARYDIGLYVATDGDPNNDGAVSGRCYRERLTPASPTSFIDDGVAPTCLGTDGTLLDLLRTVTGPNAAPDDNGYYLTAETGGSNSLLDACGDLADGGVGGCDLDANGLWDDSVMKFTDPVTFLCDDVDSDGSAISTSNDGFVNIPTCATWGNQANEVDLDGNDSCDSEAEVVNGTPAKCSCEDKNSNIPAPRLACDSSTVFCTPSTIAFGQSATCTVRYNNTISCTNPTPTPEERFRCGTASYVRFRTDFNENFGTVSNLSVSGSGTGSADVVTESGDQTILWTPSSALGTSGIIAQSEFTTLTFTYTPNDAVNRSLSFPTTVYWSDAASFSPEVGQTVASCSAALSTPVTLAAVEAQAAGDRVEVEWTTATEVGHVAFNVYEETRDGWRRVNREPIPAKGVDSVTPQHYRFSYQGRGGARVAIEDIDVHGVSRRHEPFGVGEKQGQSPQATKVDWVAVRAESRAASARVMAHAAATAGGREAAAGGANAPAAVLLVDRDGLYRVTYEELLAAGFDFAGTPIEMLALESQGKAVPLRVVAGPGAAKAAKAFGPGGFFEFHGQAADTLYTGTNPYSLAADKPAALRVGEDARAASGAAAAFYIEESRLERDREYSFGTPTSDPWYDTRLLAFRTANRWNFDLAVDGYQAGLAPATLTVELWGSTDWPASPDHHVRLSLNGTVLADERFDGRVARTLTAALPQALLREGANTVTLELPGDTGVDFDLVNLEAISVRYPRAFAARFGSLAFTASGARFEVGGFSSPNVVAYRLDPAGPVRLSALAVRPGITGYVVSLAGLGTEARYVVTGESVLSAPRYAASRPAANLLQGRAESLLITHSSFLGNLDRLVALHRAQGLTAKVIDVEDLYAQYSHGQVDPRAIRDYLRDATQRLGARYVLLVGSDTYDYRNYLGLGSVSFVPTLYVATDDLIRFAPSDPALADLDGDDLQDLAIGRLPVRTPAELDLVIAKLEDYAAKSYGRTAVFAADAFDARGGASFAQHSDEIGAALPAGWLQYRAYIDRSGVAGARQELISRLNEGVALTSFVGHSGPTAWTFSNLFSANDASGLGNAGAPTVVTQWGCWNAYFVEPRFDTLGHAFLASGDRGAAAVLGSATLLDTASAERLTQELAPRLAMPGTRIGDAVLEAKRALGSVVPRPLDALLGWTLLGDPTLVIEP
jgi:DNA gyrase inhibitor GyrI